MTTQGTPVTTGGDRGAEVKGAVAEESSQVAQTAKDQAQQVATEAKAQARDLTGELRAQVADQTSTQRDRLVGILRELGEELREMADGGSKSGTASELARQAGDRVQSLGDYLDGSTATDILDEVRSFARRRPGTFLLGAAAAGVVTGRLTRGVKAATSDSGPSSSGYSTTPSQFATTGAGYADPYDYPAADTATTPAGSYGTAAGDPLAGTTSGAWGDSGGVGSTGADTSTDPLYGDDPQYTGTTGTGGAHTRDQL